MSKRSKYIFDDIPEDWKTTQLGSLGYFSKGKGISKADLVENGIPCIRYGEIYTTHDYIIREFCSFITEQTAKESCLIKNGDILFAGSGETAEEIGKSVAYVGSEVAYAGGDIIILKIKSDINSTFLSYTLSIDSSNRQKQRLGQGHSVVHIYANSLKKVIVPLPPLAEQEKIAEILGRWDEGIEKCEKLIEAKKKLKKGLSQQLLTGKTRFKEFKNQKWKEYRLHQIVETLFSNVDKQKHDDELPVRLCNYMDVYKNQYITNDMPFMCATAKVREIDKFSLKLDDVIITKDSETPDDIANSTVIVEELENVLCGYHLAILRPIKKLILGLFLADLLMLQVVRNQFSRFANGATRFGLGVEDIKKIALRIPGINEQQKIASVLNSADKEIEILEKELEALKKQKKGLMQKLLTGKIRVKV